MAGAHNVQGEAKATGVCDQKKRRQKKFLIKVFQYLKKITDKMESDSSEMKRQEDGYKSHNREKFSCTIKKKFFLMAGGTSVLGDFKNFMGQGLEKLDLSRHEGSEPVS